MLTPSEKYYLFRKTVKYSQDDEEYAVVVNPRLLLKKKERDSTILRWGWGGGWGEK